MGYLHGITVAQLMRINVKHINRIVQLVYDPENDELSDSYSKAIKMYLVFGLERTVELLSGKYPINKAFLDNVSRLEVDSILEFKVGDYAAIEDTIRAVIIASIVLVVVTIILNIVALVKSKKNV